MPQKSPKNDNIFYKIIESYRDDKNTYKSAKFLEFIFSFFIIQFEITLQIIWINKVGLGQASDCTERNRNLLDHIVHSENCIL